jgi:predicted nucleic acid-binding protein
VGAGFAPKGMETPLVNELIVIDTDIIIDAGRDVREAVDCLKKMERQSKLAVSAITQMELLTECRDKIEVRRIERFLQRFQRLKLTEAVSDIAINLLLQYRLSHGMTIPDALIAATAIALDQFFVSKNQRDFYFIKGLKLLNYPSK